jgi:hypothetical protein
MNRFYEARLVVHLQICSETEFVGGSKVAEAVSLSLAWIQTLRRQSKVFSRMNGSLQEPWQPCNLNSLNYVILFLNASS